MSKLSNKTIYIIAGICFSLLVIVIVGAILFGQNRTRNNADVDNVDAFAKDNHISIKLAESIDNAIRQMSDKFNRKFTLKQIYNFEQVEDWANGKRYHIYLDNEYVLYIYEQDDEVVSIRKTNGDFVYKKK